MHRSILGALLTIVSALFVAVSSAAQGRYQDLLDRMVSADWLFEAPKPGERCVQFSSYDRRSDAGPESAEEWFANHDRGHYLRTVERDGRTEHVMVDAKGPGVLTRIWSANPSGELFFRVDGALVWTVDFRALCSGAVDGVPEPLAVVRARGANCYLPIPFGESLEVSSSAGDCYYQCNVTTWPAGTAVEGFTPALLQKNAGAIRAAAEQLTYQHSQQFRSATGLGLPLRKRIPRDHVVTEIVIDIANVPEDHNVGDLLRNVLLVVNCDGEITVRVPVLDFFCGGGDWQPFTSRFLYVRESSAGCCYPMPMPDGGLIALEVDGDLAGMNVGLGLVSTKPLDDPDALLFHASYHQQKSFASRPFRDFRVLDASGGPGRFVGCSLLVKNPTRAWWGEGDEKFYVDGEAFPSTFGTGTEDYFGYAWCSPELFASPFHAQPQCDGPGNYGFTALHRSQVLDNVPFQRSFRFDLEVWHWVQDLQLDYASVAYWYGAPETRSGLPAVPPAAERTLDRLGPPPVFVAEGVIEGEGLRVVACTGGDHEVQDMGSYGTQFSQNGQRWWKHGELGDTLVLAVPVQEAGKYRVLGAFCRAGDYGIVQLTLADQKLGGPFDAYHNGVRTSGKKELGVVQLPAGEAMLRVTILGSNEKSTPGNMFGLDYLELQKLL